MINERKEKCSSCYFWEFKQGNEGICRRYPPSAEIKPINQSYEIVLPLTKKDDWCGDFVQYGKM